MDGKHSGQRRVMAAAISFAGVTTAAVVGLAGMGGCQSMARTIATPSGAATPMASLPPEAVSTRPMVKVTAADLYSWGPGAATQQLEFYDELERRDLVAHDDLLHATLLFAQGSSGATYQQRLDLAKGRGWLDKRFNRPGREAVTVGEATMVMARMMGTAGGESPEAAVDAFRGLGLIPSSAAAGQGLTGPQLLALLTSSYDYLQSGETGQRPMAQRPQDPPVAWVESMPPTAAAEEAESFEQFQAPAAAAATLPPEIVPLPEPKPAAPQPTVAAAAETPRAMKEPLPTIPLAETPRPAPTPAAPTPPAPPQPEPKPAVTPPAVPPAAPAPAPAVVDPPKPQPTPRPWVGGKPLNKKGRAGN